jgi:hypothetical protein
MLGKVGKKWVAFLFTFSSLDTSCVTHHLLFFIFLTFFFKELLHAIIFRVYVKKDFRKKIWRGCLALTRAALAIIARSSMAVASTPVIS